MRRELPTVERVIELTKEFASLFSKDWEGMTKIEIMALGRRKREIIEEVFAFWLMIGVPSPVYGYQLIGFLNKIIETWEICED